MNKKEYQQKIKNMKRPKFFNAITLDEAYEAGFEEAKNNALFESCFLDEPEKPVLTEEEAEWVDKLTEFFNTPDALYRITRCGYSHLFTFDFCGDTYELPVEEGTDYVELNIIKERLVNAVLYGYEVRKEKLYTVEIPNPNRSGRSVTFLARKSDGKVELYNWTGYTSIDFEDRWKQQEYAQLTEEEIKEDFAWAWEANLAKEEEE